MPSVGRIVAQAAGGTAYFMLPIWGWDGLGPFFAHPAFIALTVIYAGLIVLAFFAGGNISSGVREDRSNRWVLVAFTVLGLLAAYLPAYTDRIGFWIIDGGVARWIGVALFALGGTLRLSAVFALGNRFSGLVAIQPGHRLLTTGLYQRIRHPSYLGLMINSLGWALAFRSVVGVLLTALMLVPLLARIAAEERFLQSEFGADYDAYRARTARLVPGIY
jgi:protein-S-isoprenylcysteine O-methyltransferase Ste14